MATAEVEIPMNDFENPLRGNDIGNRFPGFRGSYRPREPEIDMMTKDDIRSREMGSDLKSNNEIPPHYSGKNTMPEGIDLGLDLLVNPTKRGASEYLSEDNRSETSSAFHSPKGERVTNTRRNRTESPIRKEHSSRRDVDAFSTRNVDDFPTRNTHQEFGGEFQGGENDHPTGYG